METKIINGHTYEKVSGGWQLRETQAEKPQRGFAGELLPSAFAVGGGILGGIAGAPAGPAGVIGGGIVGATGGGALGETVQQSIEKKFGERRRISTPQIVGAGVVSGATQTVGGVAAKGLASGAKFIASKTKQPMISFFKVLSGYNDEMITRALERTPGVTTGLKEGESALAGLITRSTTAVNNLAKKYVTESKTKLTELMKTKLSEDSLFAKALSSSAQKYKSARTEIFNKFGDFSNRISTTLRQSHNIGVEKSGALNFARPNQPSRIVNMSEQKAIQEAYSLVKSVRNNLSLKHIDSIYERLIVLKSKTPTGSPTGTEARAVIKDITESLHQFIQKVYPKEYTQYLAENLQKRLFINNAKELVGDTAHLTPKEQTIVANRLLQLFNTGRLPQRQFAETLGGEIGEDVVGTVAGTAVKTGGQISLRAQNLTQRGLIEKLVEALPRKALENYIQTGKLTGELANNPILVNTAKTIGVTTKAALQEVAQLWASKTTR